MDRADQKDIQDSTRYSEIIEMDSNTLLDQFEEMIRQGAGSHCLEMIWFRSELKRRVEEADRKEG